MGCASGALWLAVLEKTPAEIWAALGLVGLLVWIDLRQKDDVMALVSLDRQLNPAQYGAKAARLAQLRRLGLNVPKGWGVLKEQKIDISIAQQVQPSTNHPLLVRSSAIEEDSEQSSAAGQYRTVGPVTSAAELLAAIEVCRASYGDGGAIAYRQSRGLGETGMSVLIQRYVTGKVAGVAFSRHPLNGADCIVVEALPGGAEAVVGGTQTPEHLELPREERDEQSEQVKGTLLPAEVLKELVQSVLNIEDCFEGVPQDVEWIWDGDRLWIVQSRPISTLQPIWTRTIAAEVIPGVIHPLTWSINQPLTCGVWGKLFSLVLGQGAEDLDFSQTATLLGSHAYFNATLLGTIFRRMGLPEQGLEFLLRGQKMGKPPLQSTLRNIPGLLRLLGKEGQLPQDFHRDRVDCFEPAIAQLESVALESLNPTELLARIDRICNWLVPATYYNIVGPIGLAIRRSLFKVPDRWLSDIPTPELASLRELTQLAAQLRKLVPETNSLDPSSSELKTLLLETLVRDRGISTQFECWLDRFGYLSEVGTDIAVPTWKESPDKLRSLLCSLAMQSVDQPNLQHPTQLLQKWRLRQCRERAVLQANVDEIYAKLLAHLRWTFVELERRGIAAGEFERQGDIFLLDLADVQDWVAGSLDSIRLRTLVDRRKSQLERDRSREIPLVVYGDRLPPPVHREVDKRGMAEMYGIPASGGCVEGVVKVCRTFEFAGIEPGSIVVVPYTDAGWAPLLVNAAAIVAEVGGQLSHGAIVAREYKIPAVMNVQQAMARLRDGQRVRVDGDRGIVEICQP